MDSPINFYIQHPIPIPAPNEKNKVELKPLMLTKREQKKMRKLRRKQELQDKRDRIRMGLLPPDPPKVRLVNMMKVLTSEEETYRRLARDLWDHGHVLRDDKFRWLYMSFTVFLWGMVGTAVVVIATLLFPR